MYNLIPPTDAHVDQITQLFMRTGYFEAGLKHNTLNLNAHEFMKKYVVIPYLPFTTIIIDAAHPNQVLGAMAGGLTSLIEKISSDWVEYIDKDVSAMFENLYTFILTPSFHVSFLAVDDKAYGLGLGKLLLDYAESQAKIYGIDVLSLYTFNCQYHAIQLYLNYGMRITKTISLDDKLPFSHALYFEKSKDILKFDNYFDSDMYRKMNLKKLAVSNDNQPY